MPIKSEELSAKVEPFDSFWEAPTNIEKGFKTFYNFYYHNYLNKFPTNKKAKILTISCGPGYLVHLLNQQGYSDVLGIDSMEEKAKYAQGKNLNCKAARAFEFLQETESQFDVIFCEQEVNHLTKDEIIELGRLCLKKLNKNGVLIVHSLNGANPIVGAENLALNFDHFNTFTALSLCEIFKYSGFSDVKAFPLKLYVFYKNPLNYIGIMVDLCLTILFRILFIFYGKKAKIFTKKIGAVCTKN